MMTNETTPSEPTGPSLTDDDFEFGYDFYVTNPIHGGKVTCHKCQGFIFESELESVLSDEHGPKAYFHKGCFNRYEHYYGLDKPLD